MEIIKVAGIIIKNNKILLTKKKGTSFYISPGGKPHKDEDFLSALKREIKEETNLDVKECEYFGTFSGHAQFENDLIQIHVYKINKYDGTLSASNEIEETLWVSSKMIHEINIGSIFEKYVIPNLIENGLIK